MWKKGMNGESFRQRDPTRKFNMSTNIWDYIPNGAERSQLPAGFRRSLWDWFHRDDYNYLTIDYDLGLEFLDIWRKVKEGEFRKGRLDKEATEAELEDQRKRIKRNGAVTTSIFGAISLVMIAFTVYLYMTKFEELNIVIYILGLISFTILSGFLISILVLLLNLYTNKKNKEDSKKYYDMALSSIKKEQYDIEAEIQEFRSSKYTLTSQIPALNPLGDIEDYFFQNIYSVYKYFQTKLGLINPTREDRDRFLNLKIDLAKTREEISRELPYYSVTPSGLYGESGNLVKNIKDQNRGKKHMAAYQSGHSLNDRRYLSYSYTAVPIFAVNTIHLFIPIDDKLAICRADMDIMETITASRAKLYNEEISINLASNITTIESRRATVRTCLKQIFNDGKVKENLDLDLFRIDISNGKDIEVRFPSSDYCFYLQDQVNPSLSKIHSKIIDLNNKISTERAKFTSWAKMMVDQYDEEAERNKVISKINQSFMDMQTYLKHKAVLEIAYNKLSTLSTEKNTNQDLAKVLKTYIKTSTQDQNSSRMEELINRFAERTAHTEAARSEGVISSIDRSDVIDALRIIEQRSVRSESRERESEDEIWG